MYLHIVANIVSHPADDRFAPWINAAVEAPISALIVTSLLLLLFLLCFFSIAAKSSQLRKAQAANEKLLASFRNAAHPLAMLQFDERHPLAPLDAVYQAGSREMAFHLTGTHAVNHDFLTRLRLAAKIAPTQLRSVEAAMRIAVLDGQIRLNSSVGGLSAVLKTLPWLACLTPLLVYVETLWARASGHPLDPTHQFLAAFAPLALALAGVALGQLLLQLLVVRIRAQRTAMDRFALELGNNFDHCFVNHNLALEKLPSIDAFGTDGPSFSLPPTESPLRTSAAS